MDGDSIEGVASDKTSAVASGETVDCRKQEAVRSSCMPITDTLGVRLERRPSKPGGKTCGWAVQTELREKVWHDSEWGERSSGSRTDS